MSVQSHTRDHVYLNWLSYHAIDTEIRRTSRAITADLGADAPPGTSLHPGSAVDPMLAGAGVDRDYPVACRYE
jgi:hypothetical protein